MALARGRDRGLRRQGGAWLCESCLELVQSAKAVRPAGSGEDAVVEPENLSEGQVPHAKRR